MPRRRYGVLAHLTSLPGPHGIGDLGASSLSWLDWLASAGAAIWQLLPVGPTGFGDSPYSALSSFAGNPLLIDLDELAELGLPGEPTEPRESPSSPDRVDFAAVRHAKGAALGSAWERLRQRTGYRDRLEAFRRADEQANWLEDWALYAALRRSLGESSWLDWPADLRRRDKGALDAARRELADEIDFEVFQQHLFTIQWDRLRDRAHRRGVEILGDLPFYPALDSADVWSRQDLFDLDSAGRPNLVAGVPPDAFTTTGQLWGNPVFRWRRMAESDYDWWVDRLAAALRRFDRVRLDHFRGFAAYWVVPSGDRTAAGGRWLRGPGGKPIRQALRRLGDLPLVAEDLGRITPAVRRLRRRLGFPGMRVLQFGFDDPASEHRPHRFPPGVVAYTGTHDNAPTRAWFADLSAAERQRALAYTGGEPETIHWDLLRSAMLSPAEIAIAPLQDALGLGPGTRLNRPGESRSQWSWRLPAAPGEAVARRLHRLAAISGRLTEDAARAEKWISPGGEDG